MTESSIKKQGGGSHTITLNKNNIVSDGKNSTLIYKFPKSVAFKNEQIALAQIQLYYSWENINAIPLNNSSFSYLFPNNDNPATYTSYPVVIPNGIYEIDDINFFLQSKMITNGHYLVNTSGQNVFFLDLKVSPTTYSVIVNYFAVPIALPAGYTAGTGITFGTRTTTNTPKIVISATNNFNNIIGFQAGTFPATSVLITGSQGSNEFVPRGVPQVQPNPNVNILVSNVSNPYADPQTLIYSVVPNVAIGEYVSFSPNEYLFNNLGDGFYNELRVTLADNNFNPLNILDPEITIVFQLRRIED